MAFAAPLVPMITSGFATASAATAGIGGLSTVIGGASALLGGMAASQSAKYNSRVAANNAQLMEQNASQASLQAQLEAGEQDRQAKLELGGVLAQAGASGLGIGSGSYALQRKSMNALAAKDRGNIRQAGENESNRFRRQAADYRAESKFERNKGKFAKIETALSFGSSLIGGADRVARNKILDIRAAQ